MERVLKEKELLTKDKQLKSVQTELQAEKQKMQLLQEVNTLPTLWDFNTHNYVT